MDTNRSQIEKKDEEQGYSKDSNQFAPVHILSLSFLPEETLDHWLLIKHPSKTLIRLHIGAVWSKSLMGTHANLYLFLDTSILGFSACKEVIFLQFDNKIATNLLCIKIWQFVWLYLIFPPSFNWSNMQKDVSDNIMIISN